MKRAEALDKANLATMTRQLEDYREFARKIGFDDEITSAQPRMNSTQLSSCSARSVSSSSGSQGQVKPVQISDGMEVPVYDSSFVKDKSVNSILQKMERRLRMPYVLEMDYEIQQTTDLQFALMSEHPSSLLEYRAQVLSVRETLALNRESFDRQSLAKILISLLPTNAREPTTLSFEGFKKNPVFRPEMEKMALFEQRRLLRQLLPKERKPDAQTNWESAKTFVLKSLAPKPKKPFVKNNKKKQKADKKDQKKDQQKSTKKSKSCFVCGKKGHIATQCEMLKKFKAANQEKSS